MVIKVVVVVETAAANRRACWPAGGGGVVVVRLRQPQEGRDGCLPGALSWRTEAVSDNSNNSNNSNRLFPRSSPCSSHSPLPVFIALPPHYIPSLPPPSPTPTCSYSTACSPLPIPPPALTCSCSTACSMESGVMNRTTRVGRVWPVCMGGGRGGTGLACRGERGGWDGSGL